MANLTLLLRAWPSKKDLSLIFGLVKRRTYMDTHLKEELTDLFWKLLGISYPHRESRKRLVNTVLMVNITLNCKRYIGG